MIKRSLSAEPVLIGGTKFLVIGDIRDGTGQPQSTYGQENEDFYCQYIFNSYRINIIILNKLKIKLLL